MRLLKKTILYSAAFFALTFLISVQVGLAQGDLEFSIVPDALTINTTESAIVEVVIQNNQAVSDSFSLSVFPQYFEGITADLGRYKVDIAAGSNATVELHLKVEGKAAEIITNFRVTVRSLSDTNLQEWKNVRVTTSRKHSVYISDVSLDRYTVNPGDTVLATAVITNSAEFDSVLLKLQTNFNSPVETLGRFDDNIDGVEGRSSTTLSHSFTFSKYASPGNYNVEVILKDLLSRPIDTETVHMKVNEVRDLQQTETESMSIFQQKKTLTIKNEGNVLEENFYVTDSIPNYFKLFFIPSIEPISSEDKDGRTVYTWLVDMLPPGDQYVISHEIKYAPIWILAVIIIVVSYIGIRLTYRPRVSKKTRYAGAIESGKEIVIALEVKNPTLHEIKKVVVRDVVSPIARVVDKFDTLKPTVRKIPEGTELIWKVPSLKPMEERVITYRIKPVVEIIGTLRLSKATVTYQDRKKKRRDVASKMIVIKPKK